MADGKKLIIIDSNSIIHRAYHALPPLTTKKGELVNAVYGFLLVFFKVIKEFQPDFICACFDFPAPTFRHQEFKEYKATRPPTPKDLISQILKIKEILSAFNIPIFEKEGFEADDLIGTIVEKISKKEIPSRKEIIIVSGDSDTLQLVNKITKVYLLKRGMKETILYDENLVRGKYRGLNPNQLDDFKALIGDPSDNIPGISGIGEKTAIYLLREFGTIKNLYKELEEETDRVRKIKPKLRELLYQQKEQVFLNKSLTEIKKDVPIDSNLRKCQRKEYDKGKVIEIFKNYQFHSLIKRLSELEQKAEQGQNEKGRLINRNLRLW